MLFLGRRQQAPVNLQRFRLPFAISQQWKDFYLAMRRFGGGVLSEDRLLAQTAGSRWQECNAHFLIGLFRLADGNRTVAKEHFAKAVHTRAIWEFEWNWSLMFLSRLENDPSWPPWIPTTK